MFFGKLFQKIVFLKNDFKTSIVFGSILNFVLILLFLGERDCCNSRL